MDRNQPSMVRIVEVGPRDGLQNESEPVPTEVKAAFIAKLVQAGLREIEVTSFVHPRLVPQLADATDLISRLPPSESVRFSALVPNAKGLERALESGIRRVAVFTAVSETFAQKNINMTVRESFDTFRPLVRDALAAGLSVRGYLSTCFACPYEGTMDKRRVRELTQRLLDLGTDEVAISDTIGAAVPTDVEENVGYVLDTVPPHCLALHFHDTHGTALANVCAGMQLGITTFDSSAGGLGGCPFASGASGNLATEDLVYMLERMGIATGVIVTAVAEASRVVAEALRRELPGRVFRRLQARGSAS